MLRALLLALAVLLVAGCARVHKSQFAVYDWEAQRATASDHGAHNLRCAPTACLEGVKTVYVLDAPKLTSDDLDRSSVQAHIDPQVSAPIVTARFTSQGEQRFEALTKALAHRGAHAGQPQHFLIVVDDVVRASPYLDYRLNPDGIRAENGFEFTASSPREARKIAKGLRGS
jgi:preprotein translocase subunit SecD